MAEPVSQQQHAEYERLHATADFAELKKKYLGFVVPTTIAFMAWYLLYVVCSNWAPGLMGQKIVGTINVALVFGLLQFLTTFGIAYAYAKYSAKNMDPIADRLNQQYDEEVGR